MLTYTLSFLPKKSNPLFIAAEKFSFHLTRVGSSSFLNENSCVQIFWEKFSKNSQNHITRVRIWLKCSACRSLHSPQGWSTWFWSSQPSVEYSPAGHDHACSTGGADKHTQFTQQSTPQQQQKNTPCTPRFFLCDSKNNRNTPLGS